MVNPLATRADARQMGLDVDPAGPGPKGAPTNEPAEADLADLRRDSRFYLLVAGGLAVAVALVAVLAGSLGSGSAAAPVATIGPNASPSAHVPSPTLAPPRQDANTRFLATYGKGYPDRWNPCEPIHWVVNLQGAPAGAMPSVLGAIQRVSKATGIRFVFDGDTRTTPTIQVTSQMRAPSGQWRPLLMSWGERSLILKFTDPNHVAAVGIPRPGSGPTANEYVSGLVIVNAGIDIPLGFGARWSLGVVLMHELGHVMGLAHVPSAHEIMWSPNVVGAAPRPDPRQTTYGTGDLAGLLALGRDAGCLPPRESN